MISYTYMFSSSFENLIFNFQIILTVKITCFNTDIAIVKMIIPAVNTKYSSISFILLVLA